MQPQLNERMAKIVAEPVVADSLRADNDSNYRAPKWFSAHRQHHANFYNAVRTRKPFFEDSVFGFRTAGPSLLTNTSLWEERVCSWNPQTLTAA